MELQKMQSRVGSMPPRVADNCDRWKEGGRKRRGRTGREEPPQLTHPRTENGAILVRVLFSH